MSKKKSNNTEIKTDKQDDSSPKQDDSSSSFKFRGDKTYYKNKWIPRFENYDI